MLIIDILFYIELHKKRGEKSMTNVFYMCFGIFIFVLGQVFQKVYTLHLLGETPDVRKSKHADKHQETKEIFIEVPDELENTLHLHEDAPEQLTYEHAIQTYPDVKKTPATPPHANEDGLLFDYAPSLHSDIDVEIMTAEREIEIYKRANMLGGI